MSQIHYFQRYSKKENVVTNNTLLLLTRLYNESYTKFQNFLSNFLDGTDISIGLQFSQQTKNKDGSIPDGSIAQESFKIAIETKMDKSFEKNQLERHLNGSFKNQQSKILWAISPEKMQNNIAEEIRGGAQKEGIFFAESTFEEIVYWYRSALNDYDFELQEIISDFEDFCISENLILNFKDKLMLIPSSLSMEENVEHNIYYCPENRNYSTFSYLGLYSQKAIRYLGKLENIVKAELNDKLDLIIQYSTSEVNADQKARIINIINSEKEGRDWDLKTGHQFFIVDKFYETYFTKDSPGGQQRNKFFNLSKYGVDVKKLNTSDIANALKGRKWGDAK